MSRFGEGILGGHSRTDKAIAAARHGLYPCSATGHFIENPAQRGNLHSQIAFLDCKPGPRGFDQRVFGDRFACPVQQQSKQRNRAPAKPCRFGAVKQEFPRVASRRNGPNL